MQRDVLTPMREASVNPTRTKIDAPAALTELIKAYAKELGANSVGVAEYAPKARRRSYFSGTVT